MTNPKPALLIVHGAYFIPETWQPFIDVMKSNGFEVRCPRLPTCGDQRPPQAVMADDVAAVQRAAEELQHAGHPIVVLAHSFGGVIASESLTNDLHAQAPLNHQTPGIIRLIYLCAHMPSPGNSLGDVFAKYGFLSDVDLDMRDDGTAFPKNAPASFYNDMPTDRAEHYIAKNVTHNLGLVGDTKISSVPWKDIPATYVYCDQDMAMKKELQEAMVKDAISAGGKFNTTTLDSGHCPFLSIPEQVVAVIKKVWEAAE